MLVLNNVSYAYKEKLVLKDISLEINQGDFVGVVGPNGSGKTTLLKLMSGWFEPLAGNINFLGKDLKNYKKKELACERAVVLVSEERASSFFVNQYVAMGRYAYDNLKDVSEIINLMGLEEIKDRRLSELSSGERQRVEIAQALAQQPKLLLLDEPVSHLDICYQIEILKILKKIAKSCNLAIIMTIHDLNAAGFFCEKVICLNKGELAYYDKPSQVLTPEIIKKVFGVDAFYKNSLCFFS